MGQERARGIVHEHTRRPELGQLLRLLDERVRLARAAGAVHEPGVKVAPRVRDRSARLAEVRHVVQGIVEPEDLDSVLGSAGDEATDDVTAHGLGAHEKAPAERDPERSRDARLDRTDALPGRLCSTPHCCIEDTPARDLEAGEPRLVEDLRNAQDLGGRQGAREGLLRQEPDGRIDEPGHESGP